LKFAQVSFVVLVVVDVVVVTVVTQQWDSVHSDSQTTSCGFGQVIILFGHVKAEQVGRLVVTLVVVVVVVIIWQHNEVWHSAKWTSFPEILWQIMLLSILSVPSGQVNALQVFRGASVVEQGAFTVTTMVCSTGTVEQGAEGALVEQGAIGVLVEHGSISSVVELNT
jgi:hypothetical protein